MREKRFQRTVKGYQRCQEKAATQAVVEQQLVEEFWDPEIESPYVGGGDPGIAELMSTAAEEMIAEQNEP